MYELVSWSLELDLNDFYKTAAEKGFVNNSSQQLMVDCFKNEREKKVWIFYCNNVAAGAVAAHSLDIMGPDSYRICARTCTFTDRLPVELRHIKTLNTLIKQHQNVTDQFYIPEAINWIGKHKDLYITTNNSPIASQKLVHTIYCPTHAKTGIFTFSGEHFYRGSIQSFWKVNVEEFLEDLNKFTRWKLMN